MPAYAHLLTEPLDFDGIQKKVDAMVMLGVPYGALVRDGAAPAEARTQATAMATDITAAGGPSGLESKKVIALIAYMQRLGKDVQQAAPAAVAQRPMGGGK